MQTRLAALMLFVLSCIAMADAAAPSPASLDVSGVTAVRVTGEAGSIALTTNRSKPFEAALGARRAGWFSNWTSSWFYDDCRTASRMDIEGSTLVVDMRAPSWLEPSDCRVELKANLPEGIAVAIEQAASQVGLAGDFSTVSLDTRAADVTLDGHAVSIALHSDALRSHLAFRRTDANETITIAARSLDASFGFAAGTKISYDVKATAALVDSALPSTAGSKPTIAIQADYVRATIR